MGHNVQYVFSEPVTYLMPRVNIPVGNQRAFMACHLPYLTVWWNRFQKKFRRILQKYGLLIQQIHWGFWLIWHTCQWAYAIMVCPSCVIVHCCHHHHWHHCWCCLCTAVPVTALITETSYLTNICTYIPSICTWNIGSIWYIFLKWQPF